MIPFYPTYASEPLNPRGGDFFPARAHPFVMAGRDPPPHTFPSHALVIRESTTRIVAFIRLRRTLQYPLLKTGGEFLFLSWRAVTRHLTTHPSHRSLRESICEYKYARGNLAPRWTGYTFREMAIIYSSQRECPTPVTTCHPRRRGTAYFPFLGK